MTRIGIAADHAGFNTKKWIISHIQRRYIFHVIDFGTHARESIDYPDVVPSVTNALLEKKIDYGVLICGSGIGVSIVANRTPGIRAALCFNTKSAMLARAHNDANILVIGGNLTPPYHVIGMIAAFMHTPFDDGRHRRRIHKIDENIQ